MNELPVTQSGSQNDTQAPQSSANQAAVQPGAADTVLNTAPSGVRLTSTPVSTVTLPKTATLTTARQDLPSNGGSNVVLSSVSILLFVVAAVLFYVTSRPVKNTTK